MPSSTERKITIVAKLDSTQPNGHSFGLGNGLGGPADLTFNKDVDKMNKDGFYEIEFNLDNQNGANLIFSKDREDVLWACPKTEAKPNGCPPDNTYMDSVFYVNPRKEIQNKKLHVINTDMYPLHFVFAFNFLNRGPDGPRRVTYDPGGENQNGGHQPFEFANHFTAIVVGAIVGLVTFFGARLLLDG